MKLYTKDKCINGGHSVSCESAEKSFSVELHTHDFIEIVYVFGGRAAHTVNGVRYELRRGDFLFMNVGCTHEFFSADGFSYVNIFFSPELVADELINTENVFSLLSLSTPDVDTGYGFGKLSFRGQERDEIEAVIRLMQNEKRAKERGWESVFQGCFNTLIVKLLRQFEKGIAQEELEGVWQELSEYIECNLNAKLTPSSLAKKCFYNPSYFSRTFKEKFGKSPSAYITDARLERAREMLNATDLSVGEIMHEVGFCDAKIFYRAFSRRYGTTPSKYRKMSIG